MTIKICDERPVECSDPACPCHDYARQEPLESISGYPKPSEGVKIDSSPRSASGINLPAPDFEREWVEAPRAMVNYVERDIAEYWFLRGMRAGEVKALTETTAAFRAMAEQRGLGR